MNCTSGVNWVPEGFQHAMQNKANSSNHTLRIGGRLINLVRPLVMGIINTTPDSFYFKSRHSDVEEVLRTAEQMINEGADVLDIGGYSSRPGAAEVSAETELSRVIPAIDAIHRRFPEIPLSLDTFRSAIAVAGLEAGASVINDITAGTGDPDMFRTVAEFDAAMVIMHTRGTPATMSTLTKYDHVTREVASYLQERIKMAESQGVKELIVDPGFGFAKTRQQNFDLLRNLDHFQICNRPVLAGFSRKSMIWKTLSIEPENALNGTTALNMAALMKGASILRVHDVKAAKECVTLFCEMN